MWLTSRRTVLIVTENPTDPAVNVAFLRHPQVRLLTSYPDRQGLRLARRERPSLIIEDIQPPGAIGFPFCRDLRATRATRTIPLILVVAPELCEQALQTRAEALLVKPLARRELFEVVRRFIPLPLRNNLRYSCNLRFTYRVGEVSGQAFSRDLSCSGAFLKTDRLLSIGTRVELSFVLPGAWEEIRCHAVVRRAVHADPYSAQVGGVGVHFEEMSESEIDALETFIDRHQARGILAR